MVESPNESLEESLERILRGLLRGLFGVNPERVCPWRNHWHPEGDPREIAARILEEITTEKFSEGFLEQKNVEEVSGAITGRIPEGVSRETAERIPGEISVDDSLGKILKRILRGISGVGPEAVPGAITGRIPKRVLGENP